MVDSPSGSDRQPYQGNFYLHEDVYHAMKSRAAERPETEVGGMLFGAFEKGSKTMNGVRVEQVANVSDDQAINQETYFSISDRFIDKAVNKYIPSYTYLGNWHSHIGYGGPSSGDHEQVTKFFNQNPSRDLLIAIIQDRADDTHNPDYDMYVELYERKYRDSPDFRIHDIHDIDIVGV